MTSSSSASSISSIRSSAASLPEGSDKSLQQTLRICCPDHQMTSLHVQSRIPCQSACSYHHIHPDRPRTGHNSSKYLKRLICGGVQETVQNCDLHIHVMVKVDVRRKPATLSALDFVFSEYHHLRESMQTCSLSDLQDTTSSSCEQSEHALKSHTGYKSSGLPVGMLLHAGSGLLGCLPA